jgi:lysophospholipase L1-like esterase
MKKTDKIVLFTIFALLIGIIVLMTIFFVQKGRVTFGKLVVKENVIEEKKMVSENIVFLGDSITELYDVDKYFGDYYHVQSGVSGNKTWDILNNMQERVYRYNPSKVFINLGINNFIWDRNSSEKVVEDIKEICDKIHERNPYAEIYIEAIFPYSNVWKNEHNGDADDEVPVKEKIVKTNEELKKYAKEKDFTYIDLYTPLANEDGYFSSEYSDDGLHPNEEGYKLITEKLLKYMK